MSPYLQTSVVEIEKLPNVLLYSLPAFILWAAYYAYLYYRVRRNPLATAIGTYNATRRAWVTSILKNKKHILAIQTLRNWSMSAAFLASTASLLALGVLSFVLNPDDLVTVALNHNDFLGNGNFPISSNSHENKSGNSVSNNGVAAVVPYSVALHTGYIIDPF